MTSVAVGETPSITIRFGGENAKRIEPFVKKFSELAGAGKPLEVELKLSGKAMIVSASKHGSVELEAVWLENPTTEVDLYSGTRTKAQHSTLRGIERFVAWAMLNRRPTEREVEFVHEAVLEEAAPAIMNPVSGKYMPKRTGMMSLFEMSKCIEHALIMLGLQDISDDVFREIGGEMSKLWSAWYSWRYSNDDPLFAEEQTMDWETYKERHPVCEICGIAGNDSNPLERQHIVSAGADGKDYEQPWNWICGHRSHHALQHQRGWNELIAQHPHIKGKIQRARNLARKASQ